MARRRKFDVFTISFLDTICCAFGAIVLIYMIINAAGARSFQKDTSELRAEVDRLEEEVLEGYKDLVVLRNSLDETAGEDAGLGRGGAHHRGDGAAEGAARAVGQGNAVADATRSSSSSRT